MTPDLDIVYSGLPTTCRGWWARWLRIGRTFEGLQRDAIAIDIDNQKCLVVSLPRLIALKRAAGRGKDREAVAEVLNQRRIERQLIRRAGAATESTFPLHVPVRTGGDAAD